MGTDGMPTLAVVPAQGSAEMQISEKQPIADDVVAIAAVHSGAVDVRADEPAMGVDTLFASVYGGLKAMAHRELRRSSDHTLNTTALVHELYVKLSAGKELAFSRSEKFFGYAALAMRHILVDRAFRRTCLKSGGNEQHVELDDPSVDSVAGSPQLALQLDAALTALERFDTRAARVVELHYFAGLPMTRVAEVLGVTRRTIDRDWRYARAFLLAHAE